MRKVMTQSLWVRGGLPGEVSLEQRLLCSWSCPVKVLEGNARQGAQQVPRSQSQKELGAFQAQTDQCGGLQ